ncbi:DUF3078 domain-containing protein [Flavobacterium sp. FPG59]|uniref:DUF3078 domain-containing protein n=1 Tax=Flavobacterium sp. FPG59 TaxID=1929267 RepID=UPI000A391640|nr:DUF3078 domain-containing protein [Flavobacterium sp. FPG59]OUD37438.1 hypothetical protein FPG59_01670 [Flavobacterium sp. FPG59]
MNLLRYLIIFSFAISQLCFSQDTIQNNKMYSLAPVTVLTKTDKIERIPLKIRTKTHLLPFSYWSKKNSLGFDISEVAFVNWSAGGTSSISGLLKGKFHRNYARDNYNWSNELIIKYGLNKQDGVAIRKTEDAIQLNSTFGYRRDTLSNWFHSAKFNFNTQFTNGFAYPNTENAISKPFAPAYIFMGIGAENIDKEKKRTLYISPFTFKTTLVLDQRLANQGAFGVVKATYDLDGNLITEGEKAKVELGFLVTNKYKKEIFKNINLENRLTLYSDYINRFGNIDIDCDLQVELVVNQYVKANIGAHVIYDDDIKSKREIEGNQVTEGPKTQLRQAIGVGIEYAF